MRIKELPEPKGRQYISALPRRRRRCTRNKKITDAAQDASQRGRDGDRPLGISSHSFGWEEKRVRAYGKDTQEWFGLHTTSRRPSLKIKMRESREAKIKEIERENEVDITRVKQSSYTARYFQSQITPPYFHPQADSNQRAQPFTTHSY